MTGTTRIVIQRGAEMSIFAHTQEMDPKRSTRSLASLVRRPKYQLSVIAFLSCAIFAGMAQAQNSDQSATSVESTTDVNVTASPQSGAQSQSGGNVFDFSSGGGRNTVPGPNLPSFAGGPCMGVSGGVSVGGPGFSVGGGRSYEDKACQRRNWVQTLVGVSQHMPAAEANELKRVAIALMMQDEYLAPAFAALGHDVSNPGQAQRPQAASAAPVQRSNPAPARRANQPAVMAQNCVAVVPANASPEFSRLVSARGCNVRTR